ncbi:cytochrome c4 [Bradyrhizobium sp. CB82]|uniref:c-type cytochrome n=1 Tax=Bradyrhizobium sp. CB82 TaxID=3039159 RepID=UPI0024B22EEB|nr:cytochrome c4 [Bradyrhizobium sp. CB82]WFU38714.1 cytochrome c4 [Bradyrhizobium sp. CB82]
MVGNLSWVISGGMILGALLMAAPTFAQSIAEKVEVCAGCHGQDGKPSDKSIPIIWGQQAGYIYIQLRDFKRGDRKSEIKQPIVSSLDKQDMLAIAQYFAQKPWPDLGQPRAPKQVAQQALSAEHSVGCTGCHLDRFQGSGTTPRLAGQSREYLAKTIADFRTRARGNNPGMTDLMLATPVDDLTALAQYLAGL